MILYTAFHAQIVCAVPIERMIQDLHRQLDILRIRWVFPQPTILWASLAANCISDIVIVSFFYPYHMVGGHTPFSWVKGFCWRSLWSDYIFGLNFKGVASFLYMMPIEKREWQAFLCRKLTQNIDRAVSYRNEHEHLPCGTSCLKSQRTS